MRLITIDICKRGEPIRFNRLQSDHNFMINQLCSMMPALNGLKRSVFSPVVVALGDSLAFGLLLTETPQMELLLSQSTVASERIIRVDPTVLDDVDILNSWAVTKDVIISAGLDADPAAPAVVKSILKRKARASAAKRRRVRADTYLLSLHGEHEKLLVPEYSFAREETQVRTYRCRIRAIAENYSAQVGYIREVTVGEPSPEKFYHSRKVSAVLTGDAAGLGTYEWFGRLIRDKQLVDVHAQRVFDLDLNETLILKIVAVEAVT